ncbi:hypothetical protein INR49_025518 [Caranx melampygus]|nr:hypothetical protein INR49_025518 [Caranx melampygus]
MLWLRLSPENIQGHLRWSVVSGCSAVCRHTTQLLRRDSGFNHCRRLSFRKAARLSLRSLVVGVRSWMAFCGSPIRM